MQNVPYTIAVDGIMAFNQSYLNLPKDSQLSYLDLGNKVKALLYDERGVTPEKIRNAKSAVYTITWKDSSKKILRKIATQQTCLIQIQLNKLILM